MSDYKWKPPIGDVLAGAVDHHEQTETRHNADTSIAYQKRIAELDEQLHYTKGCCDLAMKHRDEAEAKLARVGQVIVDLDTQCTNSHAVKQLRKALEQDDG